MVKLLLESNHINVGIVNNDKKTCYEAYNDQFGLDEAASLVEKKHLKGDINSEKRGSKLYFNDLNTKQRETILDKKISREEKQKIIEAHMFSAAGDFLQDDEIRSQIKLSQDIQDRLRQMQSQQIYDPLKYLDQETLRKSLQKKLLEFSGTTLIQNIKNL